MGMKGKKSKNKRVSLKQKHRVIKKVKEHHKKKAKEARKLGFSQNSKADKDAGVPPNNCPNKEQELQALEAKRARIMEGLEQKKAANKERAKKRKLGSEDCDIAKLANVASTRQRNFVEGNEIDDGSTISKVRDNSERAFYKELVKVVDASDVILEVLDARDPLGTRCVDMERMVFKAGADKHLVLLLNKIDLVPREAVEKWLKYLREELPAVAFKCSTQEQKSNLGWKSAPKSSKSSNLLQTSDCLGAETLIKLLKNYSRSHEIKKSITVGVIGLPNVGKSSLINSLKRCQVVNVGATPGLTRSMQEVHLDKNIKLLDCPGVVMLRSVGNEASVALRNCKKIEKLEDPVGPVKEILKLCPATMLAPLYKLPSFDNVDDFLYKVATARGKLKKGGIVDIGAAARIVLHDWNEGKIPFYTMPPTRTQAEPSEARIVTELGKEFNIDEVYNTETSFIGSLKSTDDVNHVEVAPNCPLNFDENMLEDNVQAQPSTQSNNQGNEMSEYGDDDESMGSEEDEAEIKAKSAGTRQNEKLYAQEGMLNTRLKKAEKKRRKKAKLSAASRDAMMHDDNDEDEDSKGDHEKADSAMDVGGSGGKSGGSTSQTRFDVLSSAGEIGEE